MNLLKKLLLSLFLFVSAIMIGNAKEKKDHIKNYVKVKQLYVEAEKAILSNRNYHMKDIESRNYGLNLKLDLDITEDYFVNSKITSMTDANQFRFIGLDFDVGYKVLTGLEIYYKHFSGHVLDDKFKQRFPEDNSLGVRFKFIGD